MTMYKKFMRRRTVLGIVAVILALMLVAAACGEEAAPEPTEEVMEEVMEEAVEEVMEEDVMEEAVEEEMVEEVMEEEVMEEEMVEEVMEEEVMEEEPGDGMVGLRGPDEWTVENPATLEEVEAELEKLRGGSLVFVSWGGAYQSAQRQAFIVPFVEKFGIEVIEESVPTIAKQRAMAETGNITWHVIDWGTPAVYQMSATGHLEELDFSIIDNRKYMEIIKCPYCGGGSITWSEVLAYNTDTYPDGLPDMSAYYDTERYPGRRGWAYYSDPEEVFVLLGDNPSLLDTMEGRSSLSRLSDEQLDRAYDLFEQYGDQVTMFWQTGSDCPQLLISGELDMCTAWNGRIYDAAREGAPIAICWHCGHKLNTGVFVVPDGLAEQDPDQMYLVNLFIAWVGSGKINADNAKFISYGPVNLDGLPYLDDPAFDEVRDELPSSSSNIPYAILTDEKWAGETGDARYERYLEWQQNL